MMLLNEWLCKKKKNVRWKLLVLLSVYLYCRVSVISRSTFSIF